MLEGAYFAPNLVKTPVPVLLVQQLFAAAGDHVSVRATRFSPLLAGLAGRASVAFLAMAFSGQRLQLPRVLLGVWRDQLCPCDQALLCHPCGWAHGACACNSACARIGSGLLIVFSVLLLLLSMRGTRRQLVATTGWLIFAVGGIIPLCWQITTLPLFLLFASAIEIFFQNFLTGAVSASLLGITEQQPPLGTDRNGETLNLEKRVTP